MKYIQCPMTYNVGLFDSPRLFMAGGITNVQNWQDELMKKLAYTDLIVFNPRRVHFDKNETKISEQIGWEYNHLNCATGISFWFSYETVQPITLFELGRWSSSSKQLFVGCHPDYPRCEDVIIQLKLQRPDVDVVHSLDAMSDQIINWAENH
jgi:hypothetical protein